MDEDPVVEEEYWQMAERILRNESSVITGSSGNHIETEGMAGNMLGRGAAKQWSYTPPHGQRNHRTLSQIVYGQTIPPPTKPDEDLIIATIPVEAARQLLESYPDLRSVIKLHQVVLRAGDYAYDPTLSSRLSPYERLIFGARTEGHLHVQEHDSSADLPEETEMERIMREKQERAQQGSPASIYGNPYVSMASRNYRELRDGAHAGPINPVNSNPNRAAKRQARKDARKKRRR